MKAKAIPFILFLVLSVCCLPGSAPAANARGALPVKITGSEARVTLLEGSARVQSGRSAWRPLKSGNSLKGGDEVQIDRGSRLEIRLPDQSALRFAEDTRFKIVSIDMGGASNTRNARVNVSLGKAWANISKTVGSNPNIEMSSRNAVCGVRGTVYRMNVEQDASVLVRVYDGEVNVSGGGKSPDTPLQGRLPRKVAGPTVIEGPHPVSMEEWTYIVRSMQQIRIGRDGIAQKPESFDEAQDRDEWVDWNRSMDSRGPDKQGGPVGTGLFNWFRN